MFDLFGKVLYPVFGIAVLLGYVYCVNRGVELFEADSERHTIAGVSGSRSGSGGAHYRAPSVFRFGGLGGK
jgi:hypothetical protein